MTDEHPFTIRRISVMARKTAFISTFLLFFVVYLPRIQSAGFPCKPSQFTCTNQRCIMAKWRCDEMDDCGDGSDEKGCPPRTCNTANDFTCNNGRCIRRSWKCDQVDDCDDNSDEIGCPSPAPVSCPSDHFTCANKMCVPQSFRCDDEDDCGDGSDEQHCSKTCSSNQFRCDNGRCVTLDFRCDQEDDCNDLSDERGCANKTCSPTEFTCSLSGRCIPARYRCDGRNDCMDGSDEKQCQNVTRPTKPPAICRKNERVCSDGTQCIHREWICDGSNDCTDGSDEKDCGTLGCTSSEFTCANQACIPKEQRCDGKNNCGDGSDERSCPTPAPSTQPLPVFVYQGGSDTNYTINPNEVCKPGFFRCGSSTTCIANSKVCDKTPQCPHGEDERNCDINECLSNNGHCLHICTDTKTSFYCSCKPGYELMDDRKSCQDINECEIPGMCSQTCINTKGSFKCSCLDGYVMEPDKRRCKAQGPRPYLMFTNRNSIRLIMTDGKEYKQAFKNLHDAKTLGFDVQESTVYWTDGQQSSILKAKMESKTVQTVVESGMVDPSGLAVDWVGKKLYWSDSGTNSILVAEMNGTNKKTLITNGLDKPSSLVVDPSEGNLYWIDWGSPAKIERASMDGTNRKVLISGDHIERPAGLTIDYTTRKLYWVDSKLKTIKHCNLNGSAIRELVSTGLMNPSAVAVFEDDIYWADMKSIKKANKFTGKNVTVLVSDAMSPQDARIYHPQRQPSVTSRPCAENNGGCSHLCLISSTVRRYSCACPDGLYLQKDNKSCAKNKSLTTKPTIVSTPSTALPTDKITDKPLTTKTTTALPTNKDGIVQASAKDKKSAVARPALIIGLVVGLLLLVLIALALIFIIRRRRTPQRLEILYIVEPEADKMANGAPAITKKPDIKNRSEYKHFENINYDPNPNEPDVFETQTPPEDDDDSLNDDETRPVIPNGGAYIV